jgi:hypothetical protein
MSNLSAGLLKVDSLTVTGTQAGAIQASNLSIGNLDVSGNLTARTQAPGTSSTQVATTAFCNYS